MSFVNGKNEKKIIGNLLHIPTIRDNLQRKSHRAITHVILSPGCVVDHELIALYVLWTVLVDEACMPTTVRRDHGNGTPGDAHALHVG